MLREDVPKFGISDEAKLAMVIKARSELVNWKKIRITIRHEDNPNFFEHVVDSLPDQTVIDLWLGVGG